MASNMVININKIRAANKATRPEKATIIFDYFAPESTYGQNMQRPLVRVIANSLTRDIVSGSWMFKGVNLYRINEHGKGISGAIRTYKLNRINGLVRQPS